jgi:hypothetical protein
MKRVIALAAVCALTGCDKTSQPVHVLDAWPCTTLSDATNIQRWEKGDYGITGPQQQEMPTASMVRMKNINSMVLADCLMTHARQYATGSDPSSVVTRAVVAACLPEQQRYVEHYIAVDHNVGINNGNATIPLLQRNIENVTLGYVMEARTGHCGIKRGKAGDGPLIPDLVLPL